MHTLLIDCYDSFTHNLAQALACLGATVTVVRCDRIEVDEILHRAPGLVVLGPGPGRPEEAGCLVAAVGVGHHIPVLGVCLGHQAVAVAFGGHVVRHEVVHGHATPVHHLGVGLFEGIPQAAPMTRYHSLAVDPRTLPACLEPVAWSPDRAVMGLRHRSLPIHGVQFHPESVLSGEPGRALLDNALRISVRRAPLRAHGAPAPP